MSIQPVVSGSGSGAAAGSKMDLVDAPNATAVTALNAALAALIGTPANTGGTATLAAILGNPENSSLVARLTTLAAYLDALVNGLGSSFGTLANTGEVPPTLSGILGNPANVSLAARLIALAAQIGTLANSGGTATLAAMLGDPANSSLVARLALLYTDSQKIAAANAGGLTATADSLAYSIGEIERHFHGWERWMCAAAAANGEIHVADRVGNTGTGAFTLTSGNNTWGAWTQILGSSDTPVVAGGVKYDLHRLLILVANWVAPYFLQVAFGATGDGAVTANTFSSIVINPASNTDKTMAEPFMSRRQAAGTKAWARCWCVGQNAKTLTLMFGLHEYEG